MKIWQFGILLFFILGLGGMLYYHPPQKVIQQENTVIMAKVYYTREEVNSSIERKLKMGQFDQVFDIYTNICKDQELISLLILKAQEKKIPINLLFALVAQESDFHPNAVNKNEKSEDIGLMQLNTARFKKYSRGRLFDITLNVELGTQHLRELYDKYGSWEEALLRYNGWGDKAVLHLARCLTKEREIDKIYNSY
jgi:hypothetical protein